jgi:hypothetical protein
MVTILLVAGAVVGVLGIGGAVFAVLRHRGLLPASVLGSVCALLVITGWLLGDPHESRADAIKTGGLAGGAVIALYAMWINDRRRRTEESRHDVDRDRVSDERFAKSIELLGHEADQVRVGALHALAGLASSRAEYTQTVLDVLCSYLRRPFTHPAYLLRPDHPDLADVDPDNEWTAERIAEADRERRVRQTAQRLIADLLRLGTYDIDLSDASLDYPDLTGCPVGQFTARRARFYGAASLSKMTVHGLALFTSAIFFHRADLYGSHFPGGLSLVRVQIHRQFRVQHVTVGTLLDVRGDQPPADHEGSMAVAKGAAVKQDPGVEWPFHIED